MKTGELKKLLDLSDDYLDVVVKITYPNTTLGGTPASPIKHAYFGFDWDNGKFILIPQKDLTPTEQEFVERYKNMEQNVSRYYMENRDLRSEIKRLKAKLARKNSDPLTEGMNNENY